MVFLTFTLINTIQGFKCLLVSHLTINLSTFFPSILLFDLSQQTILENGVQGFEGASIFLFDTINDSSNSLGKGNL